MANKKPNSFSKGMQSDIDANLLPSDVYKSATNGRLLSREDNSFVLKSSEGNSLFATSELNYVIKTIVLDGLLVSLGAVSFTISVDYDTSNYSYTYSPKGGSSVDIIENAFSGFADLHASSLPFLKFSLSDIASGKSLLVSVTGGSYAFSSSDITLSATQKDSGGNTVAWGVTESSLNSPTYSYSSVGLTSFSDYIISLCTSVDSGNNYPDVIWKYNINSDGTVSSSEVILIGDFGFVEGRSIRVEKSEENEHYHRIYWTDGVVPLRTLNLKESFSYYLLLSVDDLDVFKSSNLLAFDIDSVSDGGSVTCGSHSYCYRLSTGDGKDSMVSAITNPLPVYRSEKFSNINEIHGGGAGVDSGKSISMSISGLDSSYTTIEVIDISYTSKLGGISANIISEGALVGGSFKFTHVGTEVKTPITVGELLKSSVSWTTCKDISIKDNRLFAANLSNDFTEIDFDFRLRYYKLDGGVFSETSDHINSDIHSDDFYDGAYWNSIKHPTDTTNPVYGAQSLDYNNSDTGVRVTFQLKRFDLTENKYYQDTEIASNVSTESYSNPPYYGTEQKNGDDDYYDNYQNPLFASKYTGYQRGEIYRFGILFYDLRGTPTFVKPIGDVRFPDSTTLVHSLDESDNVITTIGGASMYQTSDSLGNGYVLYPRFDVKLSEGIRSGISGYSIVRLDRTDSDKRILASGIFNQTMLYSDVEENRSMQDFIGNEYLNIYSSDSTHNSMPKRLFTFDTPESSFSSFNYKKKSGDEISISSKFKPFLIHESLLPGYSSDVVGHTSTNYGGGSHHAGARFDPKVSGNTNNNTLEFSNYIQYYQESFAFASGVDKTKDIHYGTNLSTKGVVGSASMGLSGNFAGKNFKNGCRFTTGKASASLSHYARSHPFGITTNSFDSENGNSEGSAYTLFGNETVLLALDDDLTFSDFDANRSTEKVNNISAYSGGHSYATKLYGHMTRDVSDSQYGGTTDFAYQTAKYISTGHYQSSPTSIDRNDIYGGDTFVNSYSLRKQYANYESSDDWELPSVAIIFPVESTVNIDMRDGIYFGSTSGINTRIEDSYLYNQTYSCRNTNKTYIPKPVDFKNANNFPNLVAASNLKIPGESGDSYTSFGANEIHELDLGKGPIYNIFNLRGDLFVLQSNGVSKLSVNPRVIVDNSDAATTSITTGTGLVIERSDYVDTMYGSQHYNNVEVTSNSAYWFDSYSSSFCRLVYGQGVAVQDLGITTQNASIFDSLKDYSIGDEPMDSSVGGINVYYDKRHDEVGLSITNPNKNVHVTYSELSDVMVSHQFTVVVDSVNLSGELYTIGYNDFDGGGVLSSKKIWLENSNSNHKDFYGVEATNSLDVEFVCNENVFTSKKFDKLTMYLSGNSNDSKFTKFTFTDSIGNSLVNDASLSRMSNGKHITPIVNSDGSGKAIGNYLIIKAESTISGDIELFGALIHNRPTV